MVLIAKHNHKISTSFIKNNERYNRLNTGKWISISTTLVRADWQKYDREITSILGDWYGLQTLSGARVRDQTAPSWASMLSKRPPDDMSNICIFPALKWNTNQLAVWLQESFMVQRTRLTFVPTTTCLSPGTKNDDRQYPEDIVLTHFWVTLIVEDENTKWTYENLYILWSLNFS